MLLTEILQNVNFSKVGSTNLKPMDIKDAVVKEKLSFLLHSLLKKDKILPDFEYSTFSRPLEKETRYGTEEVKWGVMAGKKKYELLLSRHCHLIFKEILDLSSRVDKHADPFAVPPIFHSIRSGASFEEISLFDATRKEELIPDSKRIEELFDYFEIADDDVYAKFKIDGTFKPQIFSTRIPKAQKKTSGAPESDELINAHIEEFGRFQRELGKWFKGGFPRRYDLGVWEIDERNPFNLIGSNQFSVNWMPRKELKLPLPIFYRPLGLMAYDVQPLHKYERMRLQRLFFNPDGCGLREVLIPTIYIHENGKIKDKYPLMTGLPNREVPLWNAKRIIKEKTDTVIICGCIQDAEALQRYNATMNENVIFTGFVGNNLDLVDFNPLNGKNVVFLISNHNGMSLAEAYFEADKVYQYLCEKTKNKGKKKLVIPEFAFVQRQVKYPDSSTIGTPEDLASAYYHNRPTIVPESTFPKFPLMGEYGFETQLAKVLESPSDNSVFVKDKKETRTKKKKDISKNAIIRSLLYHGEITLLAGYRSSGKSRFCQTLIRYIVNGDDKKFLKERFWTRCNKNTPMKIVYWNYDGVSDDALEIWEENCLDGLPAEQKKNIFIEQSPRWEDGFHKDSGRPNLEAYKNLLNEYTNRGSTLGHPVDLLIVDTLSSVWKRDKISDALQFLNGLTKTIPRMAVLVIHHTTDLGRPLGGCAAEDIPRVVLILKKIKKPTPDDSISQNEDIEDSEDILQGEDCEDMEFFRMWYNKNNNTGFEEEKLPFICVRKNIDQYDVIQPACSREEMFEVLRRYYRLKEKCSNEVTGKLLGYSERTIRDKRTPIIDAKTYGDIKKKIKEKSPQEENNRRSNKTN